MLALDGVRVLDFTRYLSGPTTTMLLGDLGADIVKVETPSGDPSRQSGPFHGTESVYFLVSNRNKRSLALDLRLPNGKEIALRLVENADVLVQNFRPGVADAMGLGYESLRQHNPRLVYCTISGFGVDSPGAEFPGFDQTAQAMSGLMSVTGTESTGPLRTGIALCDSATGAFAAVGVLAALVQRERTGRGDRVDSSLMSAALTMMSYQAQKYLSLREVPGQDGNDHPLLYPQGTFRARNGVVTIASGSDGMWVRLCETLGLDHLVADPLFEDNSARMANRHALRALIEEVLGTRDATEWVSLINAAGVPCSPVLDVGEALEHPFTKSLRMIESIVHPTLGDLPVLGQPVQLGESRDDWLRQAPPLLGEHSVEICRELGLSEERIDELVRAAVIHQWRPPDSAVASSSDSSVARPPSPAP